MDDCIEAPGYKTPDGYGLSYYLRKQGLAHRAAFIKAHGMMWADIDGLLVLHSCDNPPCINPAHLRLGTNADNARDKTDRGRWRGYRGSAQAASVLTEKQVLEARARYVKNSKTRGSPALAREYGVSQKTMYLAIKGINWRKAEVDIQGPPDRPVPPAEPPNTQLRTR
jgi:hypothetical protein